MKKGIIFSHGFGVRYDDRGLLTQIANTFPQYEAHLFDYNIPNETMNTLTVQPLTKQAKILESELLSFVSGSKSENITLICHSQGCIVAALADLSETPIDKVIFLAPPATLEAKRIIERFAQREGSLLNREGMSRLVNSKGEVTLIPAEYWPDREAINVQSIYKELSKKYDLTIVRAAQDEVLGETDFSYLSGVEIIDLPADHNFVGQTRKQLLQVIEEILP